jgi:hypothetical protein
MRSMQGRADEASISKLLEARLEENGYSDELRDMAKGKSLLVNHGWADDLETARNQDDPNITTLIETITPKAKGQSDSLLERKLSMQEISVDT